ncbi:MAG TPA: TraR/DksA family transcriptional regulator, partial [Bdellovibrionota bacterium]|nr:TraR/DksA family transcriptional regulator [Bdellovibrionota bacterium]
MSSSRPVRVDPPVDRAPTTREELRDHYPEFAKLLIGRMNEILPRESIARANLNEQVLESPGDDADVSVIDTSADYFLSLANSHQRELIGIRSALDRMDRGVYGVCENCSEPIALERLRHMPAARLCIDCQSAN